MKKLYFIVFTIIAVNLVSCGNKEDKNKSFEMYEYSEILPVNSFGNNISCSYKFYLPGKSVKSKVAKAITDSVLYFLDIKGIEFNRDNFIEKMHMYLVDYVDSTFESNFNVKEDNDFYFDKFDSLYYVGDDIICNTFYCNSYFGGVHDYYFVKNTFFDAKNGSVYDFENIFEDKSAAFDLITEKLIDMDESGKIVFMYDSVFITPQIELKPDTITFIFNPYDVASFADGIVEVPFGFIEIKECMKPSTKVYKYLSGK